MPKNPGRAQCGPGQLSGLTRFGVRKVLSPSPVGSWGGGAPGGYRGSLGMSPSFSALFSPNFAASVRVAVVVCRVPPQFQPFEC